MENRVNQIIEELVSLDPSFAQHRGELEHILANVLSAKPDPVIDANFVRKLRLQLLNKAESQKLGSVWSNLRENFMKKIFVSAGIAVVVLLVAVVGLQKLVNVNNNSSSNLLSFGSDVRVSRTADGAFGNLATLSLATGGMGGGGAAPTSAALGTDAAKSSIAYGMGGGAGVSEKMMLPPYEPVNYKYVYKGDELTLPSDKLDVLKKQSPDASSLISSLNSLGMGLVSLDSFPGSKAQSVSFNQDNGYNIYVDFLGGTVSISGYYDVKPLAADSQLCPVDGCPAPDPIKESDIPDDATLVTIANQFLSDHGISTAAYGDPEVVNDYRIQNEAMLKSNSKALVYWPDFINVVYPLKINDDEVYDESGNKMGLMVGVNIRSNKVTSVYNLSTQNYEASSYDAETDTSKIVKIAEQGGLYGYYAGAPEGKTVEIELGTPKLQYVSMWDYQMNSSQQVLVPSLVFPVTKQPTDGSFYRKAVVVPLTKNILDRYNQGTGGAPVKIMNEVTPSIAPTPKSR